MNWDAWTEELCEQQECAVTHLQSAIGDRRQLRQLERKRQEIQKAASAVRQAYEENPARSREDTRKRAYQLITGSIILTILIQVLLSVVIKLAIEWFLDHIYKPQDSSHDVVPVSAE